MRTTNDVAGVLELLPARLAEAHDDKTKLALLREAAQLRLEHKRDAAGALADLARAFPLSPRDQLIENQLRHFFRSLARALVPVIGIDLVADHREPELLNPHDGRSLIIRVGLFINVVRRPEIQRLHPKLARKQPLDQLHFEIQLSR